LYYCNTNVDILLSAHNAFPEYPSSGTLNPSSGTFNPSSGTFKVKILDSQIILKSVGASKPKDLKRIAGYGQICLREEHLSYNNNDMI
jgi:hypothetical protein